MPRCPGSSLLLVVAQVPSALALPCTHAPPSSNPQYQCLTYLGADNAIPAPETPPPSHTAGAVATSNALDFMTVAAAAASASPPKPVPLVADAKRGQGRCHSAACGRALAAVAKREVPGVLGLKELDEKAADEACTPAAAAQALARIACRLYELADALGGECEVSGAGRAVTSRRVGTLLLHRR